MTVLASVIEWDKILDVVVASFAAGVGVTAVFAFAVLGVTRGIDLGRDGRPPEAAAYAVLGVIGLLVTIAAMVFGVVVMTTK